MPKEKKNDAKGNKSSEDEPRWKNHSAAPLCVCVCETLQVYYNPEEVRFQLKP